MAATRICRHCLSTCTAGAAYCPECGRALDAAPDGRAAGRRRRRSAIPALAAALAAVALAFLAGHETGRRRATNPTLTGSTRGAAAPARPAPSPDAPRVETQDGELETGKGDPAASPEPERAGETPSLARAADARDLRGLRSLVLIEGLDAEGEVLVAGAGLAVRADAVIAPVETVLGATALRGRSAFGDPIRPGDIRGYDPQLGLVVLAIDPPADPAAIAGAPLPAGSLRLSLVPWPPGGRRTSVESEGGAADPAGGGPRLRLTGAPAERRGGVLFDAGMAAVAIARPASEFDPPPDLVIPLHDVTRLLDSPMATPLPAFNVAYYEGSGLAHLRAGERARRAGSHGTAVERFRDARALDRHLARRASDGLGQTYDGWIEGLLAAGGAPLVDVLRAAAADLPEEESYPLALVRELRRMRAFREAIDACRALAAAHPTLGAEAENAARAVVLEWARWLEGQGDFVSAAAVVADGLRFCPRDAEMLDLLGHASFRARAFEDAAEAWEAAVAVDPSRSDELSPRIRSARRLAAGPGKVVIDYAPGSRTIPAEATLNGRGRARLLVDTGASITWVAPAAATAAGVRITSATPRVRVTTAGSERELPLVTLDRIDVGGLAVADFPVIVGDLPGFEGRGLLGMDFLRHFAFENDPEAGRFVIQRR